MGALLSMQSTSDIRPPPQGDSLAILRDLVSRQRTGEFVCADRASAVHIYLRAGRIAWGTESDSPHSFGRHIRRHCELSLGQLGQLVQECQRSGLTLWQGLDKGGLATRAQMRRALHAQVQQTVRALLERSDVDCVFFDRKAFESYPEELTFSFTEVLDAVRSKTSALHLVPSLPPPTEADRSGARQMVEDVDGCVWAAARRPGERTVLHAKGALQYQPPSALMAEFDRQQLDFAAVRSGAGAVLGARIHASDASLWCGLDQNGLFGAAYAMLNRLRGGGYATPPELRATTTVHALTSQASAFCQSSVALLDREPDVLQACLLRTSHPPCLVAREHPQPLDPSYFSECAGLIFRDDGLASGAIEQFGSAQRMCVLGRRNTWLFGFQLSPDASESAWLVTTRSLALGFGWTSLAALVAPGPLQSTAPACAREGCGTG